MINEVVRQIAQAQNDHLEAQLAKVPKGYLLCVHEKTTDLDPSLTDFRLTTTFVSHVVGSATECAMPGARSVYEPVEAA